MLSCQSVTLHLAAQAIWITIRLYTLTDLAQAINDEVCVGLCHEGMQLKRVIMEPLASVWCALAMISSLLLSAGMLQ